MGTLLVYARQGVHWENGWIEWLPTVQFSVAEPDALHGETATRAMCMPHVHRGTIAGFSSNTQPVAMKQELDGS
jgi:hypothetical protein